MNAPWYPKRDAAKAPAGGPVRRPSVRNVWKKPISADNLSLGDEAEMMMRPTVEIPPKTPWMILRTSRMWRLKVKPIKKKRIVCVKRPLIKSALGLKREVSIPQKADPNVMTMLEDPRIHPTHNRVS